jgi:hypothetical protein
MFFYAKQRFGAAQQTQVITPKSHDLDAMQHIVIDAFFPALADPSRHLRGHFAVRQRRLSNEF